MYLTRTSEITLEPSAAAVSSRVAVNAVCACEGRSVSSTPAQHCWPAGRDPRRHPQACAAKGALRLILPGRCAVRAPCRPAPAPVRHFPATSVARRTLMGGEAGARACVNTV